MSNSRNVLANMKAFAELKRNAFDLSNGHVYSQKCGEIIPIKAIHTLPGDFMRVSITDQNLSFPMNTAAFMGARKEVTSYFVPYNHVYSLFNQIQASRPDPKTSALVEANSLVTEARVPLMGLYFPIMFQFWCYLMYEKFIPTFVQGMMDSESGFSGDYDAICLERAIESARNSFLAQTSFRIADFQCNNDINYEFKQHFNDTETAYASINTALLSYNSLADRAAFPNELIINVFEDYFRVNDGSPVHPIGSYCLDIVGRFRVFSWIRKLDMLGFGNLYPLFKVIEHQFDNLTYAQLSAGGSVQVLFSVLFNNLAKMATSNYRIPSGIVDPDVDKYICKYTNVYSILAYNKVFYDYFRNTYYDLKYNSRNYNIDFAIRQDNYEPIIYPCNLDIRFLDIEYHQWKKDIITGVLPNAQYGAVSGVDIDTSAPESRLNLTGLVPYGVTGNASGRWSVDGNTEAWDLSVYNGNLSGQVSDNTRQNTSHTHDFSGSVDTSGAQMNIINAFDVLQLKRAEMLQSYRQMLMRNGNRTIDIFRGLYGDAPASEDDNSPRFVDAFGSTLFVDTVVSTADTSQHDSNKGALGDLGARAVINGGGKFSFKTSDFGVLLVLGYIVPEANYPSFGLDPANRALDPESHLIPFFQNLGFTNVINADFNLYYRENDADIQTRGFAPSYYYFKTDIDRVHGNFVSLPAANLIKTGFNTFMIPTNFDLNDFVGSFNHWVPQRVDVVTSLKPLLSHLYVSPTYWDNVFLQKVTSDFESDHFVCNTRIYVDSVRKLSKLGLPNF